MKKQILSIIITVLLVAIVFSGCFEETKKTATVVESKTLYVDDDGTATYTNINNAIENASAGDTVYVYEGTYIDDYIRIDKSIILTGENNKTTEIISQEPTGFGSDASCISVYADGVTIKNFTIESERTFFGGPAIQLNSDNNIIVNNIIIGDITGIEIGSSSNNHISNNNFIANGYGIEIEYEGYYQMSKNYWTTHEIENNYLNGKPIYYYKNVNEGFSVPLDAGQVILAGCSNVIISNLNISNGYHGIQIGFSNNIEIINNSISNCQLSGINIFTSTNNMVTNNKIINCSLGIVISDNSNYNIIDNNVIKDNSNGIHQSDSSDTTIINNTFSGSRFSAISLDSDSTNNIVTRNQIFDNDYGITLSSECYGNNIFRNNFSNCSDAAIALYTYGVNNIYLNNFINSNQTTSEYDANNWDNGTHGNYWDNYTGADENNDDIGDTPYNIPGGGKQDRYPMMKPVDI